MNEEVSAPAGGARSLARKWAFAIIPAIGLWELAAHAIQIRSVVTDDEWRNARGAVESEWRQGDLVVFAPDWSDPLGREFFGDKLAGIADEARPDETRFPRAFEVSMRGAHAPELAGWTKTQARKVGPFTITTLDNPSPVKLLDDLVEHASPEAMSVARVDGAGRETECHWTHGPTTAGGLGYGPAVPGDRFVCPGNGFVGVSIIHDLEDRPRRCFFAPPAGGSNVVRVRFADVTFGNALHGHVGMANFDERDRKGPSVSLTFRAGDRVLGKIVHQDGDGWKGFELSTGELKDTKGELVADVASSGANRHYCFEADTR